MRVTRVPSALIAGAVLAAFAATGFAQSTINSSNRYAYGLNVGWMDCRGDVTNGAVVGEFVCSNYIWAANIGWICLGNGRPTNGWSYGNASADDYGVNHDGVGNLRGYAWAPNVGWIVFTNIGAPQVDLKTGVLSGYAYGANIGWIGFSNVTATGSNYFTETDLLATGPDTDGDLIPDMWEMAKASNLGTLQASHDEDGDGALDAEEYLADTDPLDGSSVLAITDIRKTPGGTDAVVTWNTELTRFYNLQKIGAMTNTGAWTESGVGLVSPTGVAYAAAVPAGSVTSQFYRVRVSRPPAM